MLYLHSTFVAEQLLKGKWKRKGLNTMYEHTVSNNGFGVWHGMQPCTGAH